MLRMMWMKPACKKMAVMNLTGNIQYWTVATQTHLPEPLIGLTTMEATKTAHLLD
jgi:hypothetical protein